MIKLFACDLDGTLLTEHNQISTADIEALHHLLEKGVEVIIASGRKDYDIKKVINMIGSSCHRVSQNGAFAYLKNDTHLHATTFPKEASIEIFNFIKSFPVVPIVSTEDEEFIEQDDPHLKQIEHKLFSPVKIDKQLPLKVGQTIVPSKFIVNGSFDVLSSLRTDLLSTFPNTVDAFISGEHVLDVAPKYTNKGNAIASIMSDMNIERSELACIGDAFNDISMFELTPHSFAMTNAHPDVKQKATYVVDSVSEAIEILKKEID
ncbi:HAD family hydrolase [Bacillus sp. HMF5848]|uniref:HAD family hydrolase n=1 Tax=Bacillus sp. HMF5848 TaxID=2495421 RepID=UPI00163B37EC|nr:HAD family hydrolase [Bacillus sp. HMF5848]